MSGLFSDPGAPQPPVPAPREGPADPFADQLREALSEPVQKHRDQLYAAHGITAGLPPVSERARPAVSPRRPTAAGASTGPATREPGTHECPGCGKPVLDHLLACRGCWAHLPRPAREAVVRGWSRDPLVAANALVAAVTWWRAHRG